jgi:hypothetical protein
MNRTVQIVLGIVILVVVAAGSFYGGTVYGQGQAQAQLAARRQGFDQGGVGQGFGQSGQAQFGAGQRTGGPGGMVFGQIEQVGDGLLVITDNNGKQTQVRVTDTTLIEKNASVSLADLKQGETVIVSGATGSDGSITARSVQVAPAGRFGNATPGAANSP